MKKFPNMQDMKMDQKEKTEFMSPSPPDYPYGLCISLCEDELEKLNLDDSEVSVGDMVHLVCMATVTSISKHDSEMNGPSCRVELQITHIAAEDEDEETKGVTSKLYKK